MLTVPVQELGAEKVEGEPESKGVSGGVDPPGVDVVGSSEPEPSFTGGRLVNLLTGATGAPPLVSPGRA